MKLPPCMGRGMSLSRFDIARIPWLNLPWGKIIGGGIGLSAGVFGMVFGVVVGHLVDELLWTHLMRRLTRRFIRTAAVSSELEPVAPALGILVLLTGAARCGRGHGTGAAISVVRDYLYDRYATSARRRRLIDIAGEEVRARADADADNAEPFLRLLAGRLTHNERAEVAWLAGRVARDVGPCARRIADDIARCLGADARLVADAARHEGELDERACMLLGVPQDADRAQVRAAYRRLAAEFHPDGTRVLEAHQREQAEEAFIRIREAYEQLMGELGEEP